MFNADLVGVSQQIAAESDFYQLRDLNSLLVSVIKVGYEEVSGSGSRIWVKQVRLPLTNRKVVAAAQARVPTRAETSPGRPPAPGSPFLSEN